MAFVLGVNAKLHYLPDASGAREAWPASAAGVTALNLVEIDTAKEVKLNLDRDKADVTTRADGGFKTTMTTLKGGTIGFKLVRDTLDTAFLYLQDAVDTRKRIAVACLDGAADTPGTQGLWADMKITKWSETQNADGVIEVDVELSLADSDVVAAWVTTGA